MISHRLTAISYTPVRSLLVCALMATSTIVFAKTELTMAHQLEGQHERELEQLVSGFNAGNQDVEVRLVKRSPNGKPSVLNLATRADLAQYLNQPDA